MTEHHLLLWLHRRRHGVTMIRCQACGHHTYATHRDKASDMAYRHRTRKHGV
jgi:ribosomal protein L37E